MSSGGPNTQRFSPFTPPLRGSFPLDRGHKCDELVEAYLKCLKAYNLSHITSEESTMITSGSEKCRQLAKEYLSCRMKHNLMTSEELDQLGFTK